MHAASKYSELSRLDHPWGMTKWFQLTGGGRLRERSTKYRIYLNKRSPRINAALDKAPHIERNG